MLRAMSHGADTPPLEHGSAAPSAHPTTATAAAIGTVRPRAPITKSAVHVWATEDHTVEEIVVQKAVPMVVVVVVLHSSLRGRWRYGLRGRDDDGRDEDIVARLKLELRNVTGVDVHLACLKVRIRDRSTERLIRDRAPERCLLHLAHAKSVTILELHALKVGSAHLDAPSPFLRLGAGCDLHLDRCRGRILICACSRARSHWRRHAATTQPKDACAAQCALPKASTETENEQEGAHRIGDQGGALS